MTMKDTLFFTVELAPASVNREKTKKIRNTSPVYAEARERAKEDKELAQKVLTSLTEIINQEVEKGHTFISLDWKSPNPMDKNIFLYQWERSKQYIEPILTNLGYRIESHWYREDWTKKTGKIGYTRIYW